MTTTIDEDIFERLPRTGALILPTLTRIVCVVCGLPSQVTGAARLCGPCRADLAHTRMHVECVLATAEARWEAAFEAFEAKADASAEWAKVRAAMGVVEPAVFEEAWRRAKARGGALAELLIEKEALDALSDEMTARREWADRAVKEIEAAEHETANT